MGEATYTATFTYQDQEKTNEGYMIIRNIVKKGKKAQKWYTKHRDEPEAIFWPKFIKKFTEISKIYNIYSGKTNDIYGCLQFTDMNGLRTDECLTIEGNKVILEMSLWHFADWTPLINYIIEKTQPNNTQATQSEFLEEDEETNDE